MFAKSLLRIYSKVLCGISTSLLVQSGLVALALWSKGKKDVDQSSCIKICFECISKEIEVSIIYNDIKHFAA